MNWFVAQEERAPSDAMYGFSLLSVNPNVRDSATTYMKYNAMMMLRIARVLLCPCDTKHTKTLVIVCCKIQIYHEHTTLQGRHEDKQLGNTRQNQKNSTTVEAASGTPFDNTSCCFSSLISRHTQQLLIYGLPKLLGSMAKAILTLAPWGRNAQSLRS